MAAEGWRDDVPRATLVGRGASDRPHPPHRRSPDPGDALDSSTPPTPRSPSPADGSAPPATFPLRVACVDAGSNAVRFEVAEFSGPSEAVQVEYERVPIRLGHRVFRDGRLTAEAMEATVQAFARFGARLARLDVARYRAVATSAVREARNRDELVGRIRDATGLELEVVSGSEEARLVHRAVVGRIDLAGGTWVLADVGGGSVEVSLVDGAGIVWSESHPMGTVRLLEELAGPGGSPEPFQRLPAGYLAALRIPDATRYGEPAGLIATGGNIETLARLAGAPRDGRGVGTLPAADLEAWIDRLARLSYRERVDDLGLRKDRADVILPAAMIYLRLARVSNARRILVPGVGVKDGLLLDLVDEAVSADRQEER